ncbi:MAG: hypothetical protein NWQ45_12305 [Congregibacter sp.]|nr:hypothetical protein [Congregibacter sp.]
MNKVAFFLYFILAAPVLVGNVVAQEPLQVSLSPRALQSSTTVNRLAQELLLSRLREQGLSNAMTSAVSLYFALGILAEGADGETGDLLQNLLLTDPSKDLAAIAPALAEQLSSDVGRDDSRAIFSLSNSLWSNTSAGDGSPFRFKESFLAKSAALYGASHAALDFRSRNSAGVINAWADEQTQGLIPTIVDTQTLKELDWAILNAALFEGSWGTKLRRISAKGDYRFTGLDGKPRAADTVRTSDYVSSVVDFDDGSVAFQLPFYGRKYVFVVHAPASNQGDLGAWLVNDSIPQTETVIQEVLSNRGEATQLTIQIPVFSFNDSVEMRKGSPMADDLGLSSLFHRSADFSRLSVDASHVSIIKQNTRFELDEDGVRAAAVTMIGGIKTTSMRPQYPRREIVVDRPFSFAIVERTTRTILFNGVVASI